jgi:hypothetical protein
MHEALMLALPIAALLVLTVLGSGLAAVGARRFPFDAQAALAPLLGFALLSVGSTLVAAGLGVRTLLVVTLVAGSALVVWQRERVGPILRAGAAPLAVALLAIGLAGAPNLAQGNWTATSYVGNTDSYLWVSQARSFLDQPPPPPDSQFPDRVASERAANQHWAVALPVANAELAWVSHTDPVDVYGALAALLAALFPLSIFAVARGCLGWTSRLSMGVGLAAAANSSLLFASYFSWQQQLAASALAFAAIGLFRCGLEQGAPRAESAAAAFLAASSLTAYRMAFAPYLAASLAIVFLACLVRRRDLRIVKAGVVFAGAFAVLAAPALIEFGRGIGRFVENNVNTPFKESFPIGFPPEALGLVPRIWGSPALWIVGAMVLSVPLLVLGAQQLGRRRPQRADFLLSGLLLLVVGYVLALALPRVPNYVSFKLLSYGGGFLLLVIFAPLALLRRHAARVALAVCLVCLTAASAAVAVVRGTEGSRSAREFAGLASAAKQLPLNAVVSVEIQGAWDQSWAVYALRDHPLSVPKAEYIFTRVGLNRAASYYHQPRTTHVLRPNLRAPVLWQRGEMMLASRDQYQVIRQEEPLRRERRSG